MIAPTTPARHQRILVIDDNGAIHDDFRKVLGRSLAAEVKMDAVEAELFGTEQTQPARSRRSQWFEVDTAFQGMESVQMVRQAMAEGRPYAMAFVDFRMPPGWDGVETAKHLWAVSPDLQVVICTAYADCSWTEVFEEIDPGDRLLILRKPFETVEVVQLACSLTEKWRLLEESRFKMEHLDQLVKARTEALETSRLAAMNMMEEALRQQEREQTICEELKSEMAERIKLEEKFREKASLLDLARDAIFVCGLDHCVTYWNRSAERLYGWSAGEMLGRPVTDLEQEDAGQFFHACNQVMQTGEWVGHLHQYSKDGRSLIVEGRWTLVRDGAGRPKSILVINTDITEQKKLEEQFLRSQRMEGIGAVAGGIAHDLNNVLTPITMAADYLRLHVTDAACRDVLDTISSSAQRGAGMVAQVLSFARGMEGQRIEVQPAHLIADIKKICSETFPKSIQLKTSVAAGLRVVDGDPTQLHQVLLNLCVNARDAMPHGGQIDLRAMNLTLDEACASEIPDARPGPYAVLEVVDNGTGIPKEVIDKIFDPFFTTKELGKGTGLGLSTTRSIVKSHGGFVQVESERGRGTCFRVYLPAREAASLEPVQEQENLLPRGADQLVLVADDEPVVRQMTRQTLEAFGYRAVLAADGAEAVSFYSQHKDEIAVVLTDMMMPVMDGAATISVLMRMNPSARIIAASGLASEYAVKARNAGARRFIPKPYSVDTLLLALKEVVQEVA